MRESLGTNSALADFRHFEIWRMANNMDGALGGTTIQDEAMTSGAAADAKRLRLGADV